MKWTMRKPIPLSLFGNKKKKPLPVYEESVKLEEDEQDLSIELIGNINKVKQILGNSNDVRFRNFLVSRTPEIKGVMIYLSCLVDEKVVNQFIVQGLVNHVELADNPSVEARNEKLIEEIKNQIISVASVMVKQDWNTVIHQILSGNTIIFVDGINKAICASTAGGEYRSIQEPTTETAIRGPKDGFIESLQTNISLIRRRIKSPHLRVETVQIGDISQTNVSIVYVESLASEKLIKEVKERINNIEIDEILNSANIEELIQDKTFTPFPTVFNTERPDVVVNNLVEGRVVILVEGTPFLLVVPTSFSQFFKAADDYYQRYDIATFIRILRYFAFSFSLLGPSLYVALITFHQDLIPTTLVINLAAQREGIPFPALIEAFLMEITFEVLREAGIRMPRAIGQAVSIVGALVIGQAAVQAGIVSAAMVIIVAATGIASFTTPSYNLAIAARILRFFMMILAGTIGLYGIMIGLLLLVTHLCSLRSFGYPYLAPFAPFIPEDQKDGLFRFPLWAKTKRPRLVSQKRPDKMKSGMNPAPARGKEKASE
ncbi:MAG: spore germination protein [Bacillaceae bacterium]|nr:spore germination protein [Bacillaceae bacterium]